jgi:hypothetical protein
MFDAKRVNGQYFTENNPFCSDGFLQWAEECDMQNHNILEPFAGSNNLIKMLQEMGLCKAFSSFDINPQNPAVKKQDTLSNFPQNHEVCITNPPYLAQNSAKRRGLFFPDTQYDDLYKFALDKCLANCKNVGAIIPASFLNAKIFRERLSHYILLNSKMFNDTEHPVCLALFKESSKDVKIYENTHFLGNLSEFEKKLPSATTKFDMKFNEKTGKLGLIAIDNTAEPSIKFCKGEDIPPSRISNSSRSITRILIDHPNSTKLINNLNEYLHEFRKETCDLFLTPFKGLRKDLKYRRRLDYALARSIINEVCSIT